MNTKYDVNIDLANETKKEMVKTLETDNERVLNKVGAFASLYDIRYDEYKEPVLVLKTEEPGSKQLIAVKYDKIEKIHKQGALYDCTQTTPDKSRPARQGGMVQAHLPRPDRRGCGHPRSRALRHCAGGSAHEHCPAGGVDARSADRCRQPGDPHLSGTCAGHRHRHRVYQDAGQAQPRQRAGGTALRHCPPHDRRP